MPSNPKRRCSGASNSFTRSEVEAACQLFELLSRGGDARVLIRSQPMQAVRTKFLRMRFSILQGRSGIGPADDGGGAA